MKNIIYIIVIILMSCFGINKINALNIKTYETITNNKIIYTVEHDEMFSHSWQFDKETYKDDINFSLNILSTSPYSNDIDNLIENKTKYKGIFFEHRGKLPTEALVTVKVSNKFNDNKRLYLYHYDDQTNKLNYLNQNLTVKNGTVKFKINHSSDYVLSSSIIKTAINNPQGFGMVIIVLLILSLVLIAAVLFMNNKN